MKISAFKQSQAATASNDLTLTGLKAVIILTCLFIIILTLAINNKLVLAGILAYIILP